MKEEGKTWNELTWLYQDGFEQRKVMCAYALLTGSWGRGGMFLMQACPKTLYGKSNDGDDDADDDADDDDWKSFLFLRRCNYYQILTPFYDFLWQFYVQQFVVFMADRQ